MILFLVESNANITATLLSILGTISTAIILATGRWGWIHLKEILNEGRQELVARITSLQVDNQGQMDRIEKQVGITNGTVANTVKDIAELKLNISKEIESIRSDAKVEHAKVEMLTEFLLGRQPDKGA